MPRPRNLLRESGFWIAVLTASGAIGLLSVIVFPALDIAFPMLIARAFFKKYAKYLASSSVFKMTCAAHADLSKVVAGNLEEAGLVNLICTKGILARLSSPLSVFGALIYACLFIGTILMIWRAISEGGGKRVIISVALVSVAAILYLVLLCFYGEFHKHYSDPYIVRALGSGGFLKAGKSVLIAQIAVPAFAFVMGCVAFAAIRSP